MNKNDFWKRVAADVIIVLAVALVGWLIYSYNQKSEELSAYKQKEITEKTEHVVKDSLAIAESKEKKAIIARVQQFVKASAESRPNFLSKSTGNIAARWWKARYNAGYETDQNDMPMYYWFKSCKNLNVMEYDKDQAKVDAIISVNSPWDKGNRKYTFMMVKEKDKWQIHNIVGDGYDLREKYGY
jgi:hypothetical protein